MQHMLPSLSAVLAAAGVALIVGWLTWRQSTVNNLEQAADSRSVFDRVWPGWDQDGNHTRFVLAVAGTVSGLALGAMLVGLPMALGFALLMGLLAPRLLIGFFGGQAKELPVALALLDESRHSMARGEPIQDALSRLVDRSSAEGQLARTIRAYVDRHERPEVAIRRAARQQSAMIFRSLMLLAVFYEESRWGPSGIEALDYLKESLELRRREADEVRVSTIDLRRFRMAYLITIPALVLILAKQNAQMLEAWVTTPLGVIMILVAIAMYVPIVPLSSWLIPSSEM